jgi:predicted dehydrogenase
MAQLLRAVETDSEPEIGGRDNLKSIALVDACYKSIAEQRTIAITEIESQYQSYTFEGGIQP